MSGYWPDAEATMGDITERLRAKADLLELMALDSPSGLCREVAEDNRAAADEIECLRDQLKGESPSDRVRALKRPALPPEPTISP